MRLKHLTVEGFRSITTKLSMPVDEFVTVILGPNDHGKTNLLAAITCLNADRPFNDNDLNWDKSHEREHFPEASYVLELTTAERQKILDAVKRKLQGERTRAAMSTKMRALMQSAVISTTSASLASMSPALSASNVAAAASPLIGSKAVGKRKSSPDKVEARATADPGAPAEVETGDPRSVPTLEQMPTSITLRRKGVGTQLTWDSSPDIDGETIAKALRESVPRAEIIRPYERIPDNVVSEHLATEAYEFMRGVFYYADLDPNASLPLFAQNDQSAKRLTRASATLDSALKKTWSQGGNLTFRLQHNSQSKSIEFMIDDPAVKDRYVRASNRSSGFTHYFAIKTILHARQREKPAASYIFLFDEPGIFLHPFGQHDLLNVLEALSHDNQVLYTTHSLFMINRTYPTRHRMVVKTDSGTTIDVKPYSNRWGSVVNELGICMSGTILFASHVLLAEGDSDPVLIWALLHELIADQHITADLNAFAVVSTGDSQNARVQIEMLREGAAFTPRMCILVDGDSGGKARLKDIQDVIESNDIASRVLDDGCEIEDYLIDAKDLYAEAALKYAIRLSKDQSDSAKQKITDHVRNAFASITQTKGLGDIARSAIREALNLSSLPSKVGIAREYVHCLQERRNRGDKHKDIKRAKSLAEWIIRSLKLPEPMAVEASVLRKE